MEAKQFTPKAFGRLLMKFETNPDKVDEWLHTHVGTTPWYVPLMSSLVESWGPDVRKHMVRILIDCMIDEIQTMSTTAEFDLRSSRMFRKNLGMMAIAQDMLFVDAILMMANPSCQDSLFMGKSQDVKLLVMSMVMEILRTVWFTQMMIDQRLDPGHLYPWMNWGIPPMSCRVSADTSPLTLSEAFRELSMIYPAILRHPAKIDFAKPPVPFIIHDTGMSIYDPKNDAKTIYIEKYKAFTCHWEAIDTWIISRHLLGDTNHHDKIIERIVLKKKFDEDYNRNLMIYYGMSSEDV
jgi:hypothetical protein